MTSQGLALPAKSLMSLASGGRGFLIALVLLGAVAMMIMPISTTLVDVIIGFNFGTAILLLMTAVYLKSPLEFSSLPGVILISTVFRLALTITTTRLILTEGDAGAIVRTFGEFVVGGSVIVGLVVFLITTIVQFIVVAKGAERVAEVSARFTLDALPGKQVSIDAEVRNGDIDQVEARRRRQQLELESQLFGAMDGAMKFVKGDAIAGLIIIFINLIGGIAIGTVQKGLSFGSAVHEYSLLTVGDALISQIPALFLSVTSATIVTRVAGEFSRDLGEDIMEQVLSDKRALALAGSVLVGMAIIPGFPTVVLLAMGGGFGTLSLLRHKAKNRIIEERQEKVSPTRKADIETLPADAAPVTVFLSKSLADAIGVETLRSRLNEVRLNLSEEMGCSCPAVSLKKELSLPPDTCKIDIENVPVAEAKIHANRLVLRDDISHLNILGIPYEKQSKDAMGKETILIELMHREKLLQAGIGFLECADLAVNLATEVLRNNAASFIGIQETKSLLSQLEKRYGELIKEVLRNTPVQRISDVFRRLLEEQVSIRNHRLVLESLAQWGEKERNPVLLAEYVRSDLKRQICFAHANALKIISASVLARETEDVLRAAVRETAVGSYLVLDDQSSQSLITQVRASYEKRLIDYPQPVVLCSVDIRRHVRSLLVRNGINLAVLSYQDLANDFTVQPISVVEFPRQMRAAE